MGRIKQYFVDQGLTPADIPKAFIFHEVISVAFAAFTWSTCYAIQPSVTLMTPLSKLPIASKAAGAFDKALAFSDKKVASMGWLKKAAAASGVSDAGATDAATRRVAALDVSGGRGGEGRGRGRGRTRGGLGGVGESHQ